MPREVAVRQQRRRDGDGGGVALRVCDGFGGAATPRENREEHEFGGSLGNTKSTLERLESDRSSGETEVTGKEEEGWRWRWREGEKRGE